MEWAGHDAAVKWLFPLLLIGCGPGPGGPPQDGPVELVQRPRHREMERFHAEALQDLEDDSGPDDEGMPQGAPREVVITVSVPGPDRGTVGLLGVSAEKLEGDWVQGRAAPDFYWASDPLDFGARVTVTAPVPKGLHYIAVLNGTTDLLPGPGDRVSRPTKLGRLASGPLALTVDRTFEDAARGKGSPLAGAQDAAPDEGGRTYPIAIEVTGVAPPRGPSTLMIVGRNAGVQRQDGRPAFFWRSEALPPRFPAELDVPLPDEGMHVLAILDVDGDRMPGKGDIASEVDRDFRRPAPGERHRFRVQEPYLDTRAVDLSALVEPQEGPAPAAVEVERALLVDTLQTPPSEPLGAFLIAGFTPTLHGDFRWPPEAQPTFLWRSGPTKLDWPVAMTGRFARGLDLIVVLDVDADGQPGPGDLSSAPLRAFEPPPAGRTVSAELGRVLK